MATTVTEDRPKRKTSRTLLVSNEYSNELAFTGLDETKTYTTGSGSRFYSI